MISVHILKLPGATRRKWKFINSNDNYFAKAPASLTAPSQIVALLAILIKHVWIPFPFPTNVTINSGGASSLQFLIDTFQRLKWGQALRFRVVEALGGTSLDIKIAQSKYVPWYLETPLQGNKRQEIILQEWFLTLNTWVISNTNLWGHILFTPETSSATCLWLNFTPKLVAGKNCYTQRSLYRLSLIPRTCSQQQHLLHQKTLTPKLFCARNLFITEALYTRYILCWNIFQSTILNEELIHNNCHLRQKLYRNYFYIKQLYTGSL